MIIPTCELEYFLTSQASLPGNLMELKIIAGTRRLQKCQIPFLSFLTFDEHVTGVFM